MFNVSEYLIVHLHTYRRQFNAKFKFGCSCVCLYVFVRIWVNYEKAGVGVCVCVCVVGCVWRGCVGVRWCLLLCGFVSSEWLFVWLCNAESIYASDVSSLS